MANLVMSLDFNDAPNHERHRYEEVSLASREGYIFGQLLRQHIFEQHSRIDYQSVCKHSTDIPQVSVENALQIEMIHKPFEFCSLFRWLSAGLQ